MLEWLHPLMPVTPKIFGRRLLPFSLGHSLLLRTGKNAYLCGQTPTMLDLRMAVAICSRNWQQCHGLLLNQGRLRWLALWSYFYNQANARQAFEAYLDDGIVNVPDHWQEEGAKNEPLKAPIEWHLARIACKEWGFLPRPGPLCVWDVPFAFAKCAADVMAEVHGDKSLVTERDKELAWVASHPEARKAAS